MILMINMIAIMIMINVVFAERELASDSCEMTPLSKDVQQWVLNTTNVEDNIEKVIFSLIIC